MQRAKPRQGMRRGGHKAQDRRRSERDSAPHGRACAVCSGFEGQAFVAVRIAGAWRGTCAHAAAHGAPLSTLLPRAPLAGRQNHISFSPSPVHAASTRAVRHSRHSARPRPRAPAARALRKHSSSSPLRWWCGGYFGSRGKIKNSKKFASFAGLFLAVWPVPETSASHYGSTRHAARPPVAA